MSVPIGDFGSDFRIGPLTGPDSRVRVQVMHLPAGGLIGRHPTAIDQLFAVVAGDAVVSGDDAKPRTIGAGYAARWRVGEEHDARSVGGCTAICVEGRFELWATAVTRTIVVEDWSPSWTEWFQQVHDLVWPAVADVAVRIDHVGSTSVERLASKPVVDLDVVVADESGLRPVIEAIRPLGYVWRGDLGVAGRQAFMRTGAAAELPEHHLYLVVDGSPAHRDHVDLRDLLRRDPEARHAYADLKRTNAAEVDGDMDLYVERKHDLVQQLLARARLARG